MADKKIVGGYYIKARAIKEKPVHKMPPYVREIWDYCLREVNHSDSRYGGHTVRRGQLFRAYKDIREDLSWYVGYRKMMYNENHTKKAMKALRDHLMITTVKKLGGVLITILNYEYYNDPKNYESTKDRTDERTTIEPMKNHHIPDNNKKNKKNKKNNIYNPLINKQEFLDNIPKTMKEKYPLFTMSDFEYFTDSIIDYCQSIGKNYKNYYATLRNFIKNEKNYQPKTPPDGGVSEEDIKRSQELQRLGEMDNGIYV